MRTVARFVGRRISDRICGGIGSCSAGVLGLLAAFTLTLLAACGGDKPTEPDLGGPKDPEPPTVATVEVSPKTAALSALGAEQAFTATAKDASGEEIEDVVVQWHSSDPSVATLDAEGTATAKAAGESTITATVDGVQAHAELTVTQTAAAVRFRTSPEDGVAGAALEPVLQVEILDEDGSVVSGATDAVTIALGSAPSGAELTGSRTANAVNGIASFSGLMIERAAEDYTLVASAGGIDPDTSSTFEIAPAPAAVLALDGEPDDAVAGDTLSALEVRVEDAYGNLIEDAELELEITIGSGPSGAVLGGTTTLETGAGEAVFDDLVLERAGERYTLHVSADGFEGVESGRFDVSAGPAALLRLESTPDAADALESFEVGVLAEDAYGNLVEADSILLELGESPRDDAELIRTPRVRERGGVTTLEASIDRPGKGFTLKASVGGLEAVESESFDVGLELVQIALGSSHACGLTSAKHAFCWGDPSDEAGLGDGTGEASRLPVPVSGGHSFETIATGIWHTCGITESGEAYCWGEDEEGAGLLGDGTNEDRLEPAAVAGGHRFKAIMAGQRYTCALEESGDVYCWGANSRGELGNGDMGNDQNAPVKVAGGHQFIALTTEGGTASQANHTCAITNAGETYCWGRNGFGQLGNGDDENSDVPVLVKGGHTFTAVSTGTIQSCAITEDNEAYCWGHGFNGGLGHGGTDGQDEPVAVAGNHTFTTVSTDVGTGCALTESGEAYCWGNNDEGQIGDGTTDTRYTPTPVAGGHTFSSIAVGRNFACALTPDHELYCWGENTSGRFGNGTTDDSLTPVRVEY